MGLSHYTEEYADMREEFLDEIQAFAAVDRDKAGDLWTALDIIMNDYGAVSWT